VESYQNYLDPQILARLEGLPLRARRIVEGYVSGVHRSPYHGFSIEFAEHREYAPGDDLRYLDWKVFGRTDKFYLKQFEEDTNLVCSIVLDISQSMCYQSPRAAMAKLDYARCAAAALAYLVLRQQDSVALVTFDEQVRASLRESSNPSHWEQLLRVMEDSAPQRKTSLGPVFHDLAERFRRRGIVVVLSDMFGDVDAAVAGLKHFRHRRHEVILLHVLDPAELEFPFEEGTRFRGLEAWPDVVADPKALRRAYLDEFQRYLRRLQQGCRMAQVDYVPMRTDRSLEVALSSYLSARLKRWKR
jgi:uncharacterized protein (DUF58 family)